MFIYFDLNVGIFGFVLGFVGKCGIVLGFVYVVDKWFIGNGFLFCIVINYGG